MNDAQKTRPASAQRFLLLVAPLAIGLAVAPTARADCDTHSFVLVMRSATLDGGNVHTSEGAFTDVDGWRSPAWLTFNEVDAYTLHAYSAGQLILRAARTARVSGSALWSLLACVDDCISGEEAFPPTTAYSVDEGDVDLDVVNLQIENDLLTLEAVTASTRSWSISYEIQRD